MALPIYVDAVLSQTGGRLLKHLLIGVKRLD